MHIDLFTLCPLFDLMLTSEHCAARQLSFNSSTLQAVGSSSSVSPTSWTLSTCPNTSSTHKGIFKETDVTIIFIVFSGCQHPRVLFFYPTVLCMTWLLADFKSAPDKDALSSFHHGLRCLFTAVSFKEPCGERKYVLSLGEEEDWGCGFHSYLCYLVHALEILAGPTGKPPIRLSMRPPIR